MMPPSPGGPLIFVAAALANRPGNGGGAWVRLSWIRGLQRLGCTVYLVEQISEEACVDEQGRPASLAGSANLRWFQKVAGDFGLEGQAALLCEETGDSHGVAMNDLGALAGEADLLLNISGNLTNQSLRRRFRRSAYLDLDPGFTHLWHAAGSAGARLSGHDLFFTIGENVGTARCRIPTEGIPWKPTRQPAVLADWPVTPGDPNLMTTVATWRGPFGPVEHEGRRYGLKAHEFRRFSRVPLATSQTFEAALDIDPADIVDRNLLTSSGWRLTDPRVVACDPAAFRNYVGGSGAEFSVAKGIYSQTNTGWFSDRSVRYLCAGKPVLVQDTGFTTNLPAGEGLIAFRTFGEAVAGAASIRDRYSEHSAAARRIAETHFDSDLVLPTLLRDAGLTA
jgi:hypothetical protein